MRRELFDGTLAEFGETLVRDGTVQVVPLTQLLCPQTLDRLLLQTYGASLIQAQRPVLVSQWSKFYCMQLIVPVVVVNLIHRRQWSLRFEDIGFALDERGVLTGVRFWGEEVDISPEDSPFARFAALLENLQRVIDRLAQYGGVRPAVLWGNAGDYLETCLRRLAAVSDAPLDAGYGLLTHKFMPDGRRNPLFNAISYIDAQDAEPIRQRRTCCLSHRVQWVGRCEHCPLD